MATEKKTKSNILKSIIYEVKGSSLSMYELSKKLNSNWDTIRKNVGLLEDLGLVTLEDQKVIYKRESIISFSEDTVAGLPLSEKTRWLVYALAKKIRDEWFNLKNEEPTNTQLQKSLVEVAETFKELKIPRGWYFYGKIVLVKINKNNLEIEAKKCNLSEYPVDLNELNKKIKNIVKDLSKFNSLEISSDQYEKKNKEDYLIKKEIESLFFTSTFDSKKFANWLYQLIFNFKVLKEDNMNMNVLSIMKEAISVMIKSASDKDMDSKPELKAQLHETFATFWKLYATYQLYETVEDLGYDKKKILDLFDEKIKLYTGDLTDSFASYLSLTSS